MIGRRIFLGAGGLWLAGLPAPAWPHAAVEPVEIDMRSSRDGGRVWFDPIGLLVPPGTRVRWINRANVHTTTAYHPDNAGRSLRIPSGAVPWDSGYMVEPGAVFEITLDVRGVYDYCCAPHEHAGMVGRIVVGTATGPGARPFGYFRAGANPHPWQAPPPAAQENFPSIARIMADGVVRLPAG